ncbi:30S ribosomal protein S17 [Candidatus Pacearchaeota archaeon]|nr:30S ribosomal protein S17 [Candidatus Pacearchaeota archaeon]
MKTQKKAKKKEQAQMQQSSVPTRGRTFEGTVTKKFTTRVVIEFERTAYVPKYERFYKKKTRLHARLPKGIQVEVGDYVRVQESRPLSKIIHHVVIEKVRLAENGDKKPEEKK